MTNWQKLTKNVRWKNSHDQRKSHLKLWLKSGRTFFDLLVKIENVHNVLRLGRFSVFQNKNWFDFDFTILIVLSISKWVWPLVLSLHSSASGTCKNANSCNGSEGLKEKFHRTSSSNKIFLQMQHYPQVS